jgi:hypothetical protein
MVVLFEVIWLAARIVQTAFWEVCAGSPVTQTHDAVIGNLGTSRNFSGNAN